MNQSPTQQQVDLATSLFQAVLIVTPFYMAVVRHITTNVRNYESDKEAISEVDIFSWVNASYASFLVLLLAMWETGKILSPSIGDGLSRAVVLLGIFVFAAGWTVLGPLTETARDVLEEDFFLKIGSGIVVQGIIFLLYIEFISPPP